MPVEEFTARVEKLVNSSRHPVAPGYERGAGGGRSGVAHRGRAAKARHSLAEGNWEKLVQALLGLMVAAPGRRRIRDRSATDSRAPEAEKAIRVWFLRVRTKEPSGFWVRVSKQPVWSR